MALSRARDGHTGRVRSWDTPLSSWATGYSSRGSEEEEAEQGKGEQSGGEAKGMWLCQRCAELESKEVFRTSSSFFFLRTILFINWQQSYRSRLYIFKAQSLFFQSKHHPSLRCFDVLVFNFNTAKLFGPNLP